MTITIVDYGVGNIGSIQNMLHRIGVESVLTSDPREIRNSRKLILPGVGAFDTGMKHLISSGMQEELDEAVLKRKIPVLGICLGMQLMTNSSEEGELAGLGWIDATTVKLLSVPEEKTKVPNMGWGHVKKVKETVVSKHIGHKSRFYFVHSYHVKCNNMEDVLLAATHGSLEFHASFESGNILGCQFHPEKSHKFGMAFLQAFSEWS